MPNKEYSEILCQGVEIWKEWMNHNLAEQEIQFAVNNKKNFVNNETAVK